MGIRHTFVKNKSTHNIIVLKIVKTNIFPNNSHKIMQFNIFFRSEEAMLDNWQKLVFNW